MTQQSHNRVIQRLVMMTVLVMGLLVFSTGLAGAQERCKPASEVLANVSTEESTEIARCWLRLAQAGTKDLQNAYLVGQNLSGMDFSNANLTWANLFAVIIDNAQFTSASLFAANLVYADIKGGKFAGADLRNADLSNSRLNQSDFTNADFRGANLTGADHQDTIRTRAIASQSMTLGINFTEWEHRGGIIETCKTVEQLTQEKADGDESYQQQRCWVEKLKSGALNLSGAYLRGARLSNDCMNPSTVMDLSGRNLSRADLSQADLRCTNLSYSNFNWADLRGARLWGADVSGASFAQANLSGAGITGARSLGANFNNVKWEKGQRIVRLRLKSMVCTLSDDEGPGNDADISLVRIRVKNDGAGMDFYSFRAKSQKDEVTVHKGYNWAVNQELLFSEDSYRGQTTFEIEVHLVESDYSMGMYLEGGGPDDERANNTEKFTVNLNSDRGDLVTYIFPISNSDVAFDLYFEAEVLGG